MSNNQPTDTFHTDDSGIAFRVPTSLRAPLWALLGFSAYVGSDSLAKFMTVEYSVYDILFWSNALISLAVGVYTYSTGQWGKLYREKTIRWHILRGFSYAAMIYINIWALSFLPLDQFYAVVFSAPVMTALIARIFLREMIAVGHWAAIFIGLIGILLITSPGGELDPRLIIVLLSPLLFSIGNIMMRLLPDNEPTLSFVAWPHFVIVATFFVLGVWHGALTVPDISGIALFLTMSGFVCLGTLFVAKAFHIGPAARVAPMHYIQMIWGIVIGYLVFGDLPGWHTIAGTVLIIASGLFLILYRDKPC